MTTPPPLPRRFRRRLALTFMAVAALAGGALAVVSFVLAREYRLDGFDTRARREAELNLRIARGADEPLLEGLLATYRQQEDHEVVAVTSTQALSSRVDLGVDDVPQEVVEGTADADADADEIELASATTELGSERYLVLGGRVPDSEAALYFFFSLDEVVDSLSEFRTALVLGWIVVAVLAALVGELVARRTLRPVRTAAAAARALTEGLLDTRLEVRTEDEFGAWAAYFNEMADALAQKIRALSAASARERRFTADVAHELRTPLTALANSSSVLADELHRLPGDLRRPAELVVEGIDRLRNLIEDLLELSRLDAGQESLHLESLALDDAVRAVLRAGGWEDDVRLDARPTPVAADRHRLERVISNLVSNAVEHGGEGVAVRVAPEGRQVVLEVSDNGPGIAPDEMPRVFDRFYKTESSPPGRGSGLGLAIAAENARLLGGTIVVRSEPGSGSMFRLELPGPERIPAPA